MTKLIFFLTFALLSLNIHANMALGQAEFLLEQNSLEGQQAGITIPNPSGGHLALVTNVSALKDGARILSLVAWQADQNNGQMASSDGDFGHTAIVLGRYNQVETSYGKYPAHEMQVAFIFSAVSNEPVQGEIQKHPTDYMERRLRSYNSNGITFLVSENDYNEIEDILEHDVRRDHEYTLNCDNCSSWAVETLEKININFEELVGPSDATPWVITDFIDNNIPDNKTIYRIANRYQGITCSNPVDITKSIESFWDRLGIVQTPLDEDQERLDEQQKNFLQTLGQYIGLSLNEIGVYVKSNGSINVATEGTMTKNISPHFSLLDFEVDAGFFAPQDTVHLNKAMLSLLKANFDLSGIQAGGEALTLILRENDEGIEVINRWLGLNLQISFYLSEKRDIRFLVKGGVALQSSNQKDSLVQVPLEFRAAVQLGKVIISYNCEDSGETHKLGLEFNFTEQDSVFVRGEFYQGKPQVSIGYRRRY